MEGGGYRPDDPGTEPPRPDDQGTEQPRPADPGTGPRPWEDLGTDEWQERWEELPAEERSRRWEDVPEERRRRQQQRSVRRGRRHRDLPAQVRRRQAIAVILIVLLVGFGAYKLFAGGEESSTTAPEQIPLAKLVGQSVVGKMSAAGPNKDLLKRVRKGQLGGVIVFAKDEASLTRDTKRLQKVAAAGGNPPLLIAIDQEGGPVKRLPGPPDTSPAQLGQSGDADLAKSEGETTGKYLARLGINVDFAPVADVAHTAAPKTLSERTFGDNPEDVAKLVVAFAEGLKSGGVTPTVKHFPGLGFSSANTDFEKATIGAARTDLEADLKPFTDAIDAVDPMVMLSTAIYPALGSGDPAAWAAPIVRNELRGRLGFDGVTITNDLEGQAVKAVLPPDRAAARALNAGVDVVLFARGVGTSQGAYEALLAQAKKGKISRQTLEASYGRITALKDGFGSND
ncbi:MAG: glycoside hydrolase family 3 N-terminal domain-containing protein [Solirubrobacterales bacterium]